jgi:hypothetical protein
MVADKAVVGGREEIPGWRGEMSGCILGVDVAGGE